jgi:hypothetical protein
LRGRGSAEAFLVLLCLVACRKSPATRETPDATADAGPKRPPTDDTCVTADDCALTSFIFDDDCCDTCDTKILNKSSKEVVERFCKEHETPLNVETGVRCARPKPADCPDYASVRKLDCIEGHCRDWVRPPPKPVGGTCATNEDCGFTRYGENCCHQCQERPGSNAAIAVFEKKCQADRDAGKLHCPGIACSTYGMSARCEQGACTAR